MKCKISIAILVMALTLAVHLPAISFPFMFDSIGNILTNEDVHITSLSCKELYRAASSNLGGFRPIPYTTFAVNYYFSKGNSAPYRIVNIIIHLLNMALLFSILFRLFKRYMKAEHLLPLISFLTLFWGLNPTATQSVTYIVQRMTSLMATFYFATLLFYIVGREKGKYAYYIFGAVSFALALLCKENALMIPVAIYMVELYFFAEDEKRFLLRSAPYITAIVALFAIIYAFNFSDINHFLLAPYSYREFTMLERVMTEFRVVVYYISLFFFPYYKRLTIDHYFEPSTSLIAPATTIISLIFIIAAVVIAIRSFKNNKLLSFGILFYFANLVIESTIIGLELAYEHRLYLPSVGMLFALAGLFKKAPSFSSKVAVPLAGIVILFFSYNAYRRNMVYKDETTFLQDAISKAPKRARLYNNLGNVLKRDNKYDSAEEHYKKAIELNPKYGEAYNNLGNLYRKQMKNSAAFENYEKAIALLPDSHYVINNYATSLMDFKRYEEAEKYLKKAIALKPCYKNGLLNLIKLYKAKGDEKSAQENIDALSRCRD